MNLLKIKKSAKTMLSQKLKSYKNTIDKKQDSKRICTNLGTILSTVSKLGLKI